MRRLLVLAVLFTLVPAFAAPVIVLSEPDRALHEKLYSEYPAPDPVLSGPAKAVQWAVDNTVTVDGWSLTGYSSTTLDEDLRRMRWKIGFIQGECAAVEYLADSSVGLVADYQAEQHRRTNLEDYISLEMERPVFGLHFVKEF